MPESERPQDRPYTKRPKPPKRLVKMQLDLDLVDALEVMAEIHVRKFDNMIDVCLTWAVWAHSHGRDPYAEMMSRPGGFSNWKENLGKFEMTPELKELARRWADEWDANLTRHKLAKRLRVN